MPGQGDGRRRLDQPAEAIGTDPDRNQLGKTVRGAPAAAPAESLCFPRRSEKGEFEGRNALQQDGPAHSRSTGARRFLTPVDAGPDGEIGSLADDLDEEKAAPLRAAVAQRDKAASLLGSFKNHLRRR